MQPIMVVLDRTEDLDTARELEWYWIASFDGLVNKAPDDLGAATQLLFRVLRSASGAWLHGSARKPICLTNN